MIGMGKPVIQDWVTELTFMQQTVLLTAVRGPDGTPKYGPVKMLQRWFRRCVLVSSLDGEDLTNPYDKRGGSFMGPSYEPPLKHIRSASADHVLHWEDAMSEIVDEYLRTLDALPHHYQLHLMHAVEIVGYKHPDKRIRSWWKSVYLRLVKDMHLNPETEAALDDRLSDSRDRWLAHADHATVA